MWGALFFILLYSGCGGGEADESATVEDAIAPAASAQERVEETEPQVGDIVCEDETEVFMIGNGGVKAYMESCTDGLKCVAEAGGCACVPDCEGKTCGKDGCGGMCGTCVSGELCHTDGVCGESCLPEGTGKVEGSFIAQMTWETPENGDFSLHDLCQSQEVIVLVEVAGW